MSDQAITLEPSETPEPTPLAGDWPAGSERSLSEDASSPSPSAAPSGKEIDIGVVNAAGNVNFSTIESQVIQLFHDRVTVRRFSCGEYGEPVPPQWEETSALSVRAADTEIDALVQHLEDRRVLLLSAERGAGKVRIAVYLAWRLRQRGRCQAPTLIAEPLDRRVRLDVRHLASRDREVQDRLVIFPDVFSRADPEVTRLFESTDRSGWQQLAQQLRARGAYLVFTTDPGDAGPLERLSAAHGVHRRLSPHPRELLESELERRLEELESAGAAPQPLRVLREKREWLLDTFRYASQLSEFVDQYLELELAGLELDEAWRRMRNADGRILQDLEGDFEGWSFAFTLALAQCGGEAGGVAWVDVDRLHRHVRQWLRRDLNLRYPAGREDADADAGADTRLEFADTPLLKRAHAEVDAGALAHTVRFRDGAPPEGMWRAMLTRHRRALLTVLPGLKSLAERGDEELRTLRVLAARIIGCIGEMDPQRITLPLLDRWAQSANRGHQAVVGPLIDGVLSSPAERYRAACLRHLQALQRFAPPGEEGDAHLPPVIAAYAWVGDHDLGWAMRELGAIAREHLDPVIGNMQRVARLLAKVEYDATEEQSAARSAVLVTCHALLRELASRIYGGRRRTFLGVQFAITDLCGTCGPVPVFRELRRWIVEGDEKTGVLVALMFLLERGVADRLKDAKLEIGAAGQAAVACNPLVLSLAEGDDAVRQTARFLGDLYESLTTPFVVASSFKRYCLESLQAHLLDWVRDALPVPEHVAALKSLFESMARTHDGILRELLLQLVEAPEFQPDDKMRAFAMSVRL
jgi:hypothetical protein